MDGRGRNNRLAAAHRKVAVMLGALTLAMLGAAYAAPASRENLSQLAASYVETAEFDPLCDEGEAYAKRLQQAEGESGDINNSTTAG